MDVGVTLANLDEAFDTNFGTFWQKSPKKFGKFSKSPPCWHLIEQNIYGTVTPNCIKFEKMFSHTFNQTGFATPFHVDLLNPTPGCGIR